MVMNYDMQAGPLGVLYRFRIAYVESGVASEERARGSVDLYAYDSSHAIERFYAETDSEIEHVGAPERVLIPWGVRRD